MPNQTLSKTAQAQLQFLKWVRVHQPKLYAQAVQSPGAMAGIFDTITQTFNKIADTVTKGAGAYVGVRSALDLTKMNIKRAKQGLMPLDSLDQYEPAGSGGAFGAIPPWVMYAGIGLVAFLILKRR